MKNHINAVFKDIKEASCSFTIHANAESFITKPGYLRELISRSISEISGKNSQLELGTDGGTSDARFIKDYCEVVELGIRNQTLHKVDEFVYLSDIIELKKIYYQIIKNFFNKS